MILDIIDWVMANPWDAAAASVLVPSIFAMLGIVISCESSEEDDIWHSSGFWLGLSFAGCCVSYATIYREVWMPWFGFI